MYDAASSPNLATCKAHGAIAMSHYLTRSYRESSPQPDATRKIGMGAALNMEGYAAELKGASRAKGRSFAEEALGAVEKGVPRNGTVKLYYSVDTDLTDLTVCDDAFRGLNDVHEGTGIQVGVYGEGGLIERLHGMGLVQGGQWLSMSEGFGGFQHALKSGLVAVVQMHDAAGNWIGTDIGGTDRNTILNPHTLGAWWPDGSPYAQGDDMSAADVAAINKHNDQNTAKIVAAITAARAETDRTAVGIAKAITTAIHGDATHPDSLASIHADLDKLIGKGGA